MHCTLYDLLIWNSHLSISIFTGNILQWSFSAYVLFLFLEIWWITLWSIFLQAFVHTFCQHPSPKICIYFYSALLFLSNFAAISPGKSNVFCTGCQLHISWNVYYISHRISHSFLSGILLIHLNIRPFMSHGRYPLFYTWCHIMWKLYICVSDFNFKGDIYWECSLCYNMTFKIWISISMCRMIISVWRTFRDCNIQFIWSRSPQECTFWFLEMDKLWTISFTLFM